MADCVTEAMWSIGGLFLAKRLHWIEASGATRAEQMFGVDTLASPSLHARRSTAKAGGHMTS